MIFLRLNFLHQDIGQCFHDNPHYNDENDVFGIGDCNGRGLTNHSASEAAEAYNPISFRTVRQSSKCIFCVRFDNGILRKSPSVFDDESQMGHMGNCHTVGSNYYSSFLVSRIVH